MRAYSPALARLSLVGLLLSIAQLRFIRHLKNSLHRAIHVDARTKRVKYASAHDFRRAFGDRWALRVMSPILMQLMRHESIETTMRYYVGRSVESTMEVLWKAYGEKSPQNEEKQAGKQERDTSRDTTPESTPNGTRTADVSLTSNGSYGVRLSGLEPETYGLKVRLLYRLSYSL